MFAQIAHAYDILKSDVSRRAYDYALKHPEQHAYNYYQYYYTKYYVRHMKVCALSGLACKSTLASSAHCCNVASLSPSLACMCAHIPQQTCMTPAMLVCILMKLALDMCNAQSD